MVTRQRFFQYGFVQYGFVLLILVQTVFCLVWAADNFGVVPAYGDTADYIARAKSLAVHRMRPFTLPLILRLCHEISTSYAIPLLFLVQTGLALAALWLLLDILAPGRRGADKLLLFLAVSTNPLLMHLNFTVLPDSLAMSFAILAAVALWKSVCQGKWFWLWPALFAVTFTLAVNARGERLVSLSLGLMLGLLLLMMLSRMPHRLTRIACCFLLAFCFHFGAGKILPKSDVTFGLNYNFTISQLACANLVFTRAEHLWPLFPEEVRAALPLEEARIWDTNAGYFYQVRQRLDPLGESAYKKMITIALRHDWPHLLYSTGAAIAHYTLSAIYPYFSFTGQEKQPKSWSGFTQFFHWQNWTYTRMAGHSPRLTWWYWFTASILVVAALSRGMVLFVRRKLGNGKERNALIFFTSAMLATTLIFIASPMLVHIRYALTWHAFALTALFSLVLPAFVGWPLTSVQLERVVEVPTAIN